MIRSGKKNVLGVLVSVVDYEGATELVIEAARCGRPLSVTALAVHGLMDGALDREQRYRLNSFDLVAPDGQPVRWTLNLLYSVGLRDRTYGPKLTLAVCERAEKEGLPVYFYGSTPEILSQLKERISRRFPFLTVAGMMCSKFRCLTPPEKEEVAEGIRKSGARIVFVGLGCPRQEVWAYEFRSSLPLPVLAVGAAFPFIAGAAPQAPEWMQDCGLEWLFRLWTEPRRLWRRYLLLNRTFLLLILMQALGVLHFSSGGRAPTQEILYG